MKTVLTLLGAALLIAPAGAAAAPAASADCIGSLCDVSALAGTASRIAQVRERPFRIVQIGDSHTAGDMITNGWRQRIDAVYGSSGRGVVTGGRPYRGYLTWGINALQSPGWSVNGIFGKIWNPSGPAVGISGYSKTATAAGEYLSLDSEAPQYMFDTFVLCGMAGPGAGSVSIGFGMQQATLSFEANAAGPLCQTYRNSAPVGSVLVTTREAKPVTITSMGTFRSAGGGISLSNLGIPSAQLEHFGRANDMLLRAELAAYQPDLIVVSFGTNEGFNIELDPVQYELTLRRQIGRLRRLTNNSADILLVGPPNSMTRSEQIAHAGALPPTVCQTGLMVPGNIAVVRGIQRRVAAEMHAAFWDWGGAMGGPCAVFDWRDAGLAGQDAVHFKRPGGDRIGALLANDFDQAMRQLAASGAQ